MVKRLKVVEDDADTQGFMRLCLERAGHQVDVVASGHEGLAALERTQYDPVLLDVQLPDVLAWDLIARMARDSTLSLIPVILVTVTEPEDAPAGIDVAGWVAKPFRSETLLATVGSVLEKAS